MGAWRWGWGAWAALTAAALTAAFSCGKSQGEDPRGEAWQQADPEADQQAVVLDESNLAVVRQTRLEAGPAIAGRLQARRAAAVRAEVGGPVRELEVEPGDSVSKGQVLVRIDSAALRDQVRAAQAGVRAARNSVKVARLECQRATQLARAGGLSAREVERANAALAAARAQLADANARLSAARKQLANTELKAPFDGVVSEKQASLGDIVQPGTPLLTVVDPSSMRLAAAVPAENLQRLRPGTPVEFSVAGYGDRVFEGRIEQINPVVDPATGQVRIYASLPNEGGALMGGLFARGRVTTEWVEALAAPLDAVDLQSDPPTVLRVREGKVERVAVKAGLADRVAEAVAIDSGLREGDVLVRGGDASGVDEGTVVRLPEELAGQDEAFDGEPEEERRGLGGTGQAPDAGEGPERDEAGAAGAGGAAPDAGQDEAQDGLHDSEHGGH